MQKYKVILFGGDRLSENGPLSTLSFYLKKNKIKFLIVTDLEHLKKKVDNFTFFVQILRKNNYEYISVKKLDSTYLKKYINKDTLGISINSIWKFDKSTINLFQGKLYNYHAADLPTERGAGVITWRILMKKKKYASINIHEVSEEFDTGKIVKSKKFILPNDKKMPYEQLSLIQKNEKLFLEKFLKDFLNKKKFYKIKQSNKNSYYWPRLNSDVDGLINWSWTAVEIIDFIIGFSKPFNGAFSFLSGTKVRIFNAKKIKLKEKFHPFQNGIIFRLHKNFFYVAVGKYALKISVSDMIGLNKKTTYYLGKRFLNE
jgi:methionyl-tRNA formyltransferase